MSGEVVRFSFQGPAVGAVGGGVHPPSWETLYMSTKVRAQRLGKQLHEARKTLAKVEEEKVHLALERNEACGELKRMQGKVRKWEKKGPAKVKLLETQLKEARGKIARLKGERALFRKRWAETRRQVKEEMVRGEAQLLLEVLTLKREKKVLEGRLDLCKAFRETLEKDLWTLQTKYRLGGKPTNAEIRRGKCIYCGKKGGTKEHLIPKSKGGTLCKSACAKCNMARGNKRPSEFPPLQQWVEEHAWEWEEAIETSKDPESVRAWLKY